MKIQNAFKCEIIIKNLNNYQPRAHFIIINNSAIVYTIWKSGETISTTGLVLIRTSSDYWFPDKSVFTSSGSSLCSNEE